MKKAFTLIELMVAIAISAVITGAIYFSLDTALESWGYSRDHLAMQKVLNEVTDMIASGSGITYGIRDGLEVIEATSERIAFVPPWTDNTHTVASRGFVYTMNRKMKPGTSVPIAEVRMRGSNDYLPIPISMIDKKGALQTQLRLSLHVPVGNRLFFTYHPDSDVNADVIKTIWWDPDNKNIYSKYLNEVTNVSENAFGVEIVDFSFRYYNNYNELLVKKGTVPRRDISLISGIEIFMKVQLGEHQKSILSFVALRNSPTRSGQYSLKEGMRIRVPDGENIHILLLNNITGAENGDVIEFEALPRRGKSWTLAIKFSRAGLAEPKIESYVVEYPTGNVVFTSFPHMSAQTGLNFMTLDPNGLFDYDDDLDIKDIVSLGGDVTLEVRKMDVEGAGLFVRP
ncbi:MAG: prepilin-type N-terminal cleavage/methylation domain-containing protein [Candidatus Omnitrophota bacterium]